MIWTSRSEQGYEVRQYGDTDHLMLDHDGLTLICRLKKGRRKGIDPTPLEPEKPNNDTQE